MGLEDRTADVIFTNPLARSDSAEQAVFDYSHLDTRDLNTAIVKCTPATSYVFFQIPFFLSYLTRCLPMYIANSMLNLFY